MDRREGVRPGPSAWASFSDYACTWGPVQPVRGEETQAARHRPHLRPWEPAPAVDSGGRRYKLLSRHLAGDFQRSLPALVCDVSSTRGEEMRNFESGATRDSVEGKLMFEGFLAPA